MLDSELGIYILFPYSNVSKHLNTLITGFQPYRGGGKRDNRLDRLQKEGRGYIYHNRGHVIPDSSPKEAIFRRLDSLPDSERERLEGLADIDIRSCCGRRGMQTTHDLCTVSRHIVSNGYTQSERDLLKEIVARRFSAYKAFGASTRP